MKDGSLDLSRNCYVIGSWAQVSGIDRRIEGIVLKCINRDSSVVVVVVDKSIL